MTTTNTFDGGVDAAHDDDVARFAAAVRSHLDDLPPDEVEELVDGLEADLIEQREDSGEPLGDAREYADELRAAAGLPPRDSRRPDDEWFGGFKRMWRNGSAWVQERRGNAAVAAVLDFLVTLRPAWWVLRGWVVFAIVFMFGALGPLPTELTGWLLLAGVVVVSVQWGRGRWLPWAWLRIAKTVVSVVAILALPGLVAEASFRAGIGASYAYDEIEVAPQELSANGAQVTNVFAYDCAGAPLVGVQLFDQDGHPLAVGSGGSDDWLIAYDEGVETALVPNPDTNPGSGWNVFPLFHARFGDGDVVPDPATFETPAPPFDAVQPLAGGHETCATEKDGESGSQPAPVVPESPSPESPSPAPASTPSAPVEP
ncbi:hypothetical protein ELQ92_15660 [Labedella populi]|uniref:Uncharacterized protein n=1 Tax=Labedella populi TaxID=2498850 RepID=A0A444Q197_9MICO|nr:hypothetical protein [Labedella populi]RWZ55060.1 hypothetical protein ELQ92_15660 [Labedella populi]